MKYKRYFVSNSSSSSFVCDLCGATASGWDASLEDCGFVQCVNGHIMCESEVPEDVVDNLVEDEWGEMCVAENMCPICSFECSSNSNMKRYLLKKYGVDEAVVFAEVKVANKRRRKLYDSEYIAYVYKLHNINESDLLKELKEEFGTYGEFLKSIR